MAKHVVVGGMFDLFHKGHKDFLRLAFDSANKITVGVTSDKFALSLGKSPFDPARTRSRNVESYIKKISGEKKFCVLQIDDIFGTAVADKSTDSIAVTENTYEGAMRINNKRAAENLKPLKIMIIPLTLASDGKAISSTRIKNGEINTEGLNYLNHMSTFKTFRLTTDLRKRLAKPQGLLSPNIEAFKNKGLSPGKLISVGDQITYNLLREGIIPRLSIVDFKVERKKRFNDLRELGFVSGQRYFATSNPPGNITVDLVNGISKILNSGNANNVIVVDGEEDLAVLPAMLLSPLGFTVVYGQINEGFVIIKVDLKSKARFLELFNNFER